MFGLQVRFQAKRGKGAELAELLLQAARSLTDHEDCRLYLVSAFPDDEDAVSVTEIWTDADAHAASLELEVTRALIERARPLIAEIQERTDLLPLGGKGLH
jgi:quinol monooxygenase YgiN